MGQDTKINSLGLLLSALGAYPLAMFVAHLIPINWHGLLGVVADYWSQLSTYLGTLLFQQPLDWLHDRWSIVPTDVGVIFDYFSVSFLRITSIGLTLESYFSESQGRGGTHFESGVRATADISFELAWPAKMALQILRWLFNTSSEQASPFAGSTATQGICFALLLAANYLLLKPGT